MIGNTVSSVLLLAKLFIPSYTSTNKNFSGRPDEPCYLDNSRQRALLEVPISLRTLFV